MKTERKKLFIRISKNHSGDYWIEEIKNKKKKISDTARDVTEDNPLTPFNKGDLYNILDFYYGQSWNKDLENTRRCGMVIDTIPPLRFSP